MLNFAFCLFFSTNKRTLRLEQKKRDDPFLKSVSLKQTVLFAYIFVLDFLIEVSSIHIMSHNLGQKAAQI